MEKQGLGRGLEMVVLDNIIKRLLDFGNSSVQEQFPLNEAESGQLCLASRENFLAQSNLLELQGHLKILGDIHGQYSDLLRFFEHVYLLMPLMYFLEIKWIMGSKVLRQSAFCLPTKLSSPRISSFYEEITTHECVSMNRIYGFYDECKRRMTVRVWEDFIDCFNCLPVAALIERKILCMHGGLSPTLTNLDQIRGLPRPSDVPDCGLLRDLLWSDPDKDVKGWEMRDRGASYAFGPDTLSKFLKKHDIELICRGHQVVEDGYEFFADRQLVTIFSAPNFCGEGDNFGAMMNVEENLTSSFQDLKPVDKTANSSENEAVIAATAPPKLQC